MDKINRSDFIVLTEQESYRSLTSAIESLSVVLQSLADKLMTTETNTSEFGGLMYESKEVSTLITNTIGNRSMLEFKEDD